MSYKHILLGVDFFDRALMVANSAKTLADTYKAQLSLIHVIDYMPIPDMGYGLDIPFDLDLSCEMMEIAKKKLADFAKKLDVEEANTWVGFGSPKMEITRIADENKMDLIVVGSHGRHGLGLLLGSTANGVLHHAKCDVLAVRLQDK